jgi:integrase
VSFYLVWPDEREMVAAGFGKVADIPAIFNSKWAYQEAPSKYLVERALRTFLPRNARMSVQIFTPKTNQVFGESLCNFLEWCELRNLDWRNLNYQTNILEGYQKELSSGSFSANLRGLAASTTNLRVEEACNFLQWAFQRGLREEFAVPTHKVKIPYQNSQLSHGHKAKEVDVRVGRARPHPASLRMPPKRAVELWLESILIEKGFTKYLMAELIIKTGIRREEAVQWRMHTLPENRRDWHVTGSEVSVRVEYGAKGGKHTNERGDRVGPSRTVLIPLEMAEKLHAYRETKRLKFFATYVKKGETPEERVSRMKSPFQQLFLSDFTGQPVSAQTLYDAWTEASRLPFKGWSPHPGRHYWACDELLKELERKFLALKNLERSQIPIDWIRGNVQDVIQLRIRPQLGHIDEATTERYLVWAIQQYRGADLSEQYERALDS